MAMAGAGAGAGAVRRVLAACALLFLQLPAERAGGLECHPRARVGTAAGSAGAAGFRDGIGAAHFSGPTGLAAGAAGELFVADAGNNCIRLVRWEASATGRLAVATTVVGGAGSGFADGPAVLAKLLSPQGLAYAPEVAGAEEPAALFVADEGNSRVRRVALDGTGRAVATVAGSGAPGHRDNDDAGQAQFDAPAGVCLDPGGGGPADSASLYVADAGSHTIRRVRLSSPGGGGSPGEVSTVAGLAYAPGSSDGVGSAASFREPRGLAFDAPRQALYVADTGNNLIRRVSLAAGDFGNVTTLAGSGVAASIGDSADAGTGAAAVFNAPRAVLVNDSWVYVSDSGAHRVRRIAVESGAVVGLAGGLNLAPGHLDGLGAGALFNGPAGLAMLGGLLYVADRNSHVVRDLAVEAPVELLLSVKAAESPDFSAEAAKARCVFQPGSLPCETEACFPKEYDAFRCSNAIREYCTSFTVGAEFDPQCKMYGHSQFGDLQVRPLRTAQDSAFSLSKHQHLELLHLGQYRVDGFPDNSTSYISDHLTYAGEVHEISFCGYPSALYTFNFRGQVNASLSEAAPTVGGSGAVLMAHRGLLPGSEKQTVWQLAGPGCRDPLSANFNPYATVDDGSCVSPYTVEYDVRAAGDFGFYSIEGPGVFVDDTLLPVPEGADADEEHNLEIPLLPGAEYRFIVSGQVNATLRGRSSTGVSSTIFDYHANNASSVFHTKFVPPAPGCTNSSFINYSPYATTDDGSCILGQEVRVEVRAADLSSEKAALNSTFYMHGAYVVASAAQGGRVWITPPHMFRTAGEWHNQTLFLPPGEHDVQFYGNVSMNVRLPQKGDTTLLAVNASEDSNLFRDEFGYALGDPLYSFRSSPGRAAFIVPLGGQEIVSLGKHGGQTGRPDATTGEGALDVPEGAIGAGTTIYVQIQRVDELFADLPRQMSQVYSYTPHRLRFKKPVTVMLPYFDHGVPSHSSEGSERLMFMQATDARGLDWRVQAGAVFQDGVGYLQTETLGLFGIFAGPEVASVEPAEVSSLGGAVLLVRGTEVEHCFGSAQILCQFGTAPLLYGVARLASGDGRQGHILCEPPALRAGFVNVELLNPERFIVSESGVQFLSREPAVPIRVFPDSASVQVASLVMVGGRHLHSTADLHRCRFQGLSGRAGVLGAAEESRPHCFSSALCACETPAGSGITTASGTSQVFLGFGAESLIEKSLKFGLLDMPIAEITTSHGTEHAGGEVGVSFSGRHALPGIVDGLLGCRIGTVSSSARRVNSAARPLACHAPLMAPGEHKVGMSLQQAMLLPDVGTYVSSPAMPGLVLLDESLPEYPGAGGVRVGVEPPRALPQLLCSFGSADSRATPLRQQGETAWADREASRWSCDPPMAAEPGFHTLMLSEQHTSGPPLRQASFSLSIRPEPKLERVEPHIAYDGDIRRLSGLDFLPPTEFTTSNIRGDLSEGLALRRISSVLVYAFVSAPLGTLGGQSGNLLSHSSVGPAPGARSAVATVANVAHGPPCADVHSFRPDEDDMADVPAEMHSARGGSAVVAYADHEDMDVRCSFGTTTHLAGQILASNLLRCVVPSRAQGRTPFTVHNGQGAMRFSASGTGGSGMLLLREPLSLSAVSPGPLRDTKGAQQLVVRGEVLPDAGGGGLGIEHFSGELRCAVGRLNQETPLSMSDVRGYFRGNCFFPRMHPMRFESLHLNFPGGGAPASSAVEFMVPAEPVVVRAFPSYLSQAGTLVTLVGRDFDPSASPACRFATAGPFPPGTARTERETASFAPAASPSHVLSSTQAVCEFPGRGPGSDGDLWGRVFLLISAAEAAAGTDPAPLALRMASLPKISKVRPMRGSYEGGTLVQLHGSALEKSSHVECFFGAVSVVAQTVNSTAAECVAPSHGPGPVPLSLQVGGGSAYASSSEHSFEYV